MRLFLPPFYPHSFFPSFSSLSLSPLTIHLIATLTHGAILGAIPLSLIIIVSLPWSTPRLSPSGYVLRHTLYPQSNYVLGGCAGILATTCVQPLDLVKTRMQLRYNVSNPFHCVAEREQRRSCTRAAGMPSRRSPRMRDSSSCTEGGFGWVL